MNETVKLILSLSLSGSILAGLIFALKPFIKHRLTKSIQYYIWLVVLLRLALPFSFETSLMNQLFYDNQTPVLTTSQTQGQAGSAGQNVSNSSFLPDSVQDNVKNGAYNYDAGHNQYFTDLFSQYVLYLWLLGVLLLFTVNLTGYARFRKHLKQTNKPASDQETRMLNALWHGHQRLTMVRNPFVSTPMLIGMLRPVVIIPDLDFSETQLKNILLHELTHLRRFDIAVKWLTMIITGLHWFNPVMYFIKKEINHACELACDEAVIANLEAREKQSYGDTLITLASGHKYPIGVLSTTMCEEKRSLQDRLMAIMQYSKKSGFIIGISVLLLVAVVAGAVLLGAGVGTNSKTPPESEKTKETTTAGYDSEYHLAKIAQFQTPYIGNHIKVLGLAGSLPAPDKCFQQQYISMVTDKRPYKLNVFYETKANDSYAGEWPIVDTESSVYYNLQKNALVLFCMIDNLDELTFSLRNSPSAGDLDTSKYDTSFSFQRDYFESKYGDLTVLGRDLEELQSLLTAMSSQSKIN